MISYLKYRKWCDWTREERYFCASLYEVAKSEPQRLARLIAEKSGLNFDLDCEWDLGYEVCLYRDYLWQVGIHGVRDSQYSPKRTFDLCLFSEATVVVVEAKVFGYFEKNDSSKLLDDREKVRELLGREDIDVVNVALASSRYFKNFEKHGSKNTLRGFDSRVTWLDLYEEYEVSALLKADELYKSSPQFAE